MYLYHSPSLHVNGGGVMDRRSRLQLHHLQLHSPVMDTTPIYNVQVLFPAIEIDDHLQTPYSKHILGWIILLGVLVETKKDIRYYFHKGG